MNDLLHWSWWISWTCHSTQIELIVYYTLSSCCKVKAALLKFRSCMHLYIMNVYWSPVQLQMGWCRWSWSTNIDPLSVESTGHLPWWALFLVQQALRENLEFDTCLVMVSKIFVKISKGIYSIPRKFANDMCAIDMKWASILVLKNVIPAGTDILYPYVYPSWYPGWT